MNSSGYPYRPASTIILLLTTFFIALILADIVAVGSGIMELDLLDRIMYSDASPMQRSIQMT